MKRGERVLCADRLANLDVDRREPVVAVGLEAVDDGEELLVQCAGDRAHGSVAYQDAVDRAGKGELLRQTYTHSAGHCGFTPAETVAGVHALVARIKSGRWPDTSAPGMTALARATGLGEARFIPYAPPPFLRPYTACTLQATLKSAGLQPFALPGQTLPHCVAP